MHSHASTHVGQTDMHDPHEDELSHELLHDVLHDVPHDVLHEDWQLVVIPQEDDEQPPCAIGAALANNRLTNRYFFDIKESLLFHKGLDT